MRNEEANDNLDSARVTDATETQIEEPGQEVIRKGNWREVFRTAFERARRQRRLARRRELGRDKSKPLLIVLAASVAFLLLFVGIISAPTKRVPLPGQTSRGQARLKPKATSGQPSGDATKAVTPMLSAEVRPSDPGPEGRVTPEDVGRTSRTAATIAPEITKPPAARNNDSQDYALRKLEFSDSFGAQANRVPSPPAATSELPPGTGQDSDLKKPSLVFVRAVNAQAAITTVARNDEGETLALPAGTRLVARLQSPVSSATDAPVVAAVEYNYERNGQIVLPAGAKVFGRLAGVNPSGYVSIRFSWVETPDGTPEKIEASAMDLNFGQLRGYVSGKKTGTKFLVRSLTGLGTVASYLVGPQGSSSAGLISADTLMRERLADNVATAGQEELNGLSFGQNLVVTVPGNTRFYIVVQKPTWDRGSSSSGTRSASTNAAAVEGSVPTLEELRQLIQLRREINELYAQGNSQSVAQPQPQR
jgi:hypothetical protein